jgi:DNA adenine methylase
MQKQERDIKETQPDLFRTSSKVLFLDSLRSQGKYKYARYRGLPLRYAGGKSLGVGHVIEHIPDGLEKLVSPFMGGGAVEIACAKELDIKVCGYDIFDILVNYWQVQLSSSKALADSLEQWQPIKTQYTEIKSRLKAHWNGETLISEPLELAAHYWYNHNLSYGPGFLGWMSKIYESPEKYIRTLQTVRNFRCPNLSVHPGRFEEALPTHSDDFLYCDPPYYLDEGEMFRGIYPQRNFPVHHKGFNHELLRDLLHEHKSGFVLSYNDCKTIREWYADFRILEVQWQYTLGQGETRIGKNRIENGTGHIKKSHELLIVKEN